MMPFGLSDQGSIAGAHVLLSKRKGPLDGFEVWDPPASSLAQLCHPQNHVATSLARGRASRPSRSMNFGSSQILTRPSALGRGDASAVPRSIALMAWCAAGVTEIEIIGRLRSKDRHPIEERSCS